MNQVGQEVNGEKVLYDATPSMIRNSPFWFLLWVASILVGIGSIMLTRDVWLLSITSIIVGILVLLFWWLRVANTRLTVTNERVTFRVGILSKNIREVFLLDIRSVQINQRFLQRILGTGHVEIASAGSGDAEIQIDGIPQPYRVKKIIDEHRRQTRQNPKETETEE